jgi:hypothetical protein
MRWRKLRFEEEQIRLECTKAGYHVMPETLCFQLRCQEDSLGLLKGTFL